MKNNMLIRILFILIYSAISGCGGGNVVSNSTDGILSVEGVSTPSTTGGQGTVSVKLIAPTGGPGTGSVSIKSGNDAIVKFTTASQSINSSAKAVFYFTVSEVENNTVVPFTVTAGALSLAGNINILGTGAINLVVTAPASTDAAGSITTTFATGAQAAGRKIAITSNNTNVAIDASEQPVDATGKAIFSYRVVNISTNTTIIFTATSGSQSVSKDVIISATSINQAPTVLNPTVNSIAFVSASPASISLKGAGGSGLTETSIVTFIVRDVTGQPSAEQTVIFTLDTSVGGTTLVPATAKSDSAGIVKTIVNAGVVSTPVRVTAAVVNTNIATKSDQLIISTGLPHQDGFSISTPLANPEAWNFDGIEVPVTVMLSDHFGNPVPDGTAVYFMVYGGSIVANATTKNGIATVNWRSQNPRPLDGKAKILAYAIGEESFTDLNGNGLADAGEFTDLPEAFLAKSWTLDSTKTYCNPLLPSYNPMFDSANCLVRNPAVDTFIDFNGDGVYNSGDGKFNGVLQGNTYLGTRRSLNIFRNYQINMSGSQAIISPQSLVINQNDTKVVSITIKDVNGNSLPTNTSIELTSTSGGCTFGGGFTIDPNKILVDQTGSNTTFNTSLKNNCTAAGSGNLIVTVTTPHGIKTTKEIAVTY